MNATFTALMGIRSTVPISLRPSGTLDNIADDLGNLSAQFVDGNDSVVNHDEAHAGFIKIRVNDLGVMEDLDTLSVTVSQGVPPVVFTVFAGASGAGLVAPVSRVTSPEFEHATDTPAVSTSLVKYRTCTSPWRSDPVVTDIWFRDLGAMVVGAPRCRAGGH